VKGKIADFGIPEIFQLVSSQGKSGALTISGDDRETTYLFSEGMIVEVLPDRRRAQSGLLGNMLLAAGYLTAEELRRMLNVQEKEGKKLGDILVEKGKISREKLGKYLYLQVKDSLYYSLRIKEGEYRFEGFAVRPPPWMTARLRADVLLMEGMQFLDEYPILREKFPHGQFQVGLKKGVSRPVPRVPESLLDVVRGAESLVGAVGPGSGGDFRGGRGNDGPGGGFPGEFVAEIRDRMRPGGAVDACGGRCRILGVYDSPVSLGDPHLRQLGELLPVRETEGTDGSE
jgi:hypothetical protein